MLVGEQDVAEFAAKTMAAFEDAILYDDAAAEAGADDGGNGSGVVGGAEQNIVAPQSARVAIINIDHGQA